MELLCYLIRKREYDNGSEKNPNKKKPDNHVGQWVVVMATRGKAFLLEAKVKAG